MGWNHTNSASSWAAECKDISQAPQGHEQERHGESVKRRSGDLSVFHLARFQEETWHLDTFWRISLVNRISCFQTSDTGIRNVGLGGWLSSPQAAAQKWGCIKTLMRLLWIWSLFRPSSYVNGFFWNAVNPGNTHFNWHPKWALELHKSTNRWPNLSLQKHGSETKKIATDGTVATKPDLDIEGETTTRVLALFDWFRVKICNNPCFNQPFPLL